MNVKTIIHFFFPYKNRRYVVDSQINNISFTNYIEKIYEKSHKRLTDTLFFVRVQFCEWTAAKRETLNTINNLQ